MFLAVAAAVAVVLVVLLNHPMKVMEEWRYSSVYSYPLHWMQVNSQLYPLSSGGEEQS
jgi:hypothetical protein